ncbi:MAG: hypothetical protein ACYDCI_04565, partial [Candidatus Limnocylindrales bacterium]
MTIALVIGACNPGAAITSPPAPMPVGIPAPMNAAFVGGSPGYDSGAQVFAFSTQLPPAEAARAYATTLAAAGYVAVGVEGAWQYFRSATALIAFEVGTSGPPTDILVRVMARDASVLHDLDPMAGSGGGDLALQTLVPQPDPPHGSPTPGSHGNGNPNPGGSPNPGSHGNGNPNPGG